VIIKKFFSLVSTVSFPKKIPRKVFRGVVFEIQAEFQAEIQAEIQVHQLSSALQTVFDEITRTT